MEEELQRTNMIKTLFIEDNDDVSIVEKIEEFEDKIDYLDFDKDKKDTLRNLCEKIKNEDSNDTKEFLFKLLQKELEK